MVVASGIPSLALLVTARRNSYGNVETASTRQNKRVTVSTQKRGLLHTLFRSGSVTLNVLLVK